MHHVLPYNVAKLEAVYQSRLGALASLFHCHRVGNNSICFPLIVHLTMFRVLSDVCETINLMEEFARCKKPFGRNFQLVLWLGEGKVKKDKQVTRKTYQCLDPMPGPISKSEYLYAMLNAGLSKLINRCSTFQRR